MLVHIKRENGKVFETKAYAIIYINSDGFLSNKEVFILNEESEFECVKQLKENTKQVMFVDVHSFENGWIKEKDKEGYKHFIHNPKLLDRIRKGEKNIFDETTKLYFESINNSKEMNYGPIKIDDKNSIDNLMEFTGGFHDSQIKSIDTAKKNEMTLLLEGIWGIEKFYLHFKGNIQSYIAKDYEEIWNFGCQIFKIKNQICFACNDEPVTIEDLNNNCMTYIIADEMFYSFEY